jgi:hypothetical protein
VAPGDDHRYGHLFEDAVQAFERTVAPGGPTGFPAAADPGA